MTNLQEGAADKLKQAYGGMKQKAGEHYTKAKKATDRKALEFLLKKVYTAQSPEREVRFAPAAPSRTVGRGKVAAAAGAGLLTGAALARMLRKRKERKKDKEKHTMTRAEALIEMVLDGHEPGEALDEFIKPNFKAVGPALKTAGTKAREYLSTPQGKKTAALAGAGIGAALGSWWQRRKRKKEQKKRLQMMHDLARKGVNVQYQVRGRDVV